MTLLEIEDFSIMAPASLVLPSIPSVPIDEITTSFFIFREFFNMRKTNYWFLPPFPLPVTLTVVSPPKIKHEFFFFGKN